LEIIVKIAQNIYVTKNFLFSGFEVEGRRLNLKG